MYFFQLNSVSRPELKLKCAAGDFVTWRSDEMKVSIDRRWTSRRLRRGKSLAAVSVYFHSLYASSPLADAFKTSPRALQARCSLLSQLAPSPFSDHVYETAHSSAILNLYVVVTVSFRAAPSPPREPWHTISFCLRMEWQNKPYAVQPMQCTRYSEWSECCRCRWP